MNTLEKIEKLEKEISELRLEISGANEEVKVHPRRWRPGSNEYYFRLNYDGFDQCNNMNQIVADDDFDRGNVYYTEEEAQRADERRKLVHELWQEDLVLLDPDWGDDEQRKYYLGYNYLHENWSMAPHSDFAITTDLPVFKEDCTEYLVGKYGDRLELLR
jgi:hypothetical protein